MSLALLQTILTNSLAHVLHLNSFSFSSAVCLRTFKEQLEYTADFFFFK